MLIDHRKQEIIKPTTPPPPMAPQVVVMTTHGTTRDEKAANPMIPCSQWDKETNTTIIWQRNYQSIKTNYIKISCTFQWRMYHSKIGCKYLANRAPKNKRVQGAFKTAENVNEDKNRESFRTTKSSLDGYTLPQTPTGRAKSDSNMNCSHNYNETRQIWGIWKLRPAYNPETPNLGQNQWCFVPCDLGICWMTLENNRASFLCCFKLCGTFHSHWWIQTGVKVRKRPIWVKFDNF